MQLERAQESLETAAEERGREAAEAALRDANEQISKLTVRLEEANRESARERSEHFARVESLVMELHEAREEIVARTDAANEAELREQEALAAINALKAQYDAERQSAREDAEAVKVAARMASHSDRIEPVILPTRKGPVPHLQILGSLARLELTDALSLPELLLETQSRLSRSATVIAIVSNMNLEKAVALQTLKKQGFRVTAIVNQFSDENFAQTSSALLDQGIPVSQLKDIDSIRGICEKTAMLK